MKLNYFKSLFVLLFLVFSTQHISAQCDMALSANLTHIACFGQDGFIDLGVTDGTPPFSYEWSDGQTDEDISMTAPGLYVVTVTDALGCVSNLARTIEGPTEALNLVLNDDGILSCSNPSSEIVPDPAGGTLPYTFFWSTGSANSSISVINAGVYTLTLTDENGCTITAQKIISASPNQPIADAGPDITATCSNAPNIIGGPGTSMGPGFAYEWYTFVGTIDPGVDIHQPTLEVNSFGNYHLRVTSLVDGCTIEDVVTVVVDNSFPKFSVVPPASLSCDVTEVLINASGSSNGPQYSYLWTTTDGHIVAGGNTLVPQVDASGTYLLTIVNEVFGCTKRGQAFVTANPALHVADAGPDTGIPCGGTEVTLDASNSTLGPQYTYQWSTSNGSIQSVANPLHPVVDQPGIYILSVFDTQNGCTKTDTVRVYPGPAIPEADLDALNVSCTGQLGFAAVQVIQGLGPNTYQWSNGSNAAILANIPTGTYSVTVTDANDCDFYATIEITDSSTLSLDTLITQPSCPAGNNGAIDLVATGDFGPFIYSWNTGDTSEDLSNLSAGTYIVTVTYALGTCSETLEVDLQEDTGLTASAVVSANNNCGSPGNGSIDLSVVPSGAYVYHWSNGVPTQDISNLTPGTYTVTINPASACPTIKEYVIENQPIFPVLTSTITHATCGLVNGSINLTVGGGVAPFVYYWSDGRTSQDISPVQPGIHTVTVVGANGCSSNLPQEVLDNNTGLNVTGTVTPNSNCAGAPNGAIDLSVLPGGAYTYSWTDGNTIADISSLSPGVYSVTVSAGGNCTQTADFTVPSVQPDFTLTPTDISCTGACTGTIDLQVINGAGPFVYFWTTSSTTQDLGNLCMGTYTVTVSDVNGCTKTSSASVGMAPDMTVTTNAIPDACGANGGLIDVAVAGGVGPYTYQWSDGSVFQTILNLTQGTYTVTVTDAAGCTKTASDVIIHTSGITITPQVTNASCGGNDGSIDISVSGLFSTFNYLWMTGATTEDLVGIAGGTYTITVTQVPGSCTEVATIVVDQQGSSMVLSTTTTEATCAGGDGAIDLTVSGGVPSYTFMWTNGSVSEDQSNLNFGTYTVTVVDGTGCSQTTSATVGQNSSLTLNAVVLPSTACNLPNGSIDLTATPAGSYNYLWSNGANTEDLNNLTPGNHTVTVDDGSGCTAVKTFNVPDSPDLPIPTALPTGTTCGLANGSVDVTVTAGVLPYTYLWSIGVITQDLTNIPSGIYNLTVTGGNGCTQQAVANVLNTNPAITLSGTITASSSCVMENGAVDLDLTPAGNYTYTWSVGTTGQDLTGIGAGTYTVTVSAGGFCTETATYLVPNDANSPAFQISSLSNNCTSETLSGPDQPGVSYAWTGPNGFADIVKIITVNTSGVYTLTVTDNMSGCTGTNDYTVNLSGSGACGAITGRVFHDEDESCSLNFGESSLAGWIVRAEGVTDTLYGVTNAQGKYLVGVPVGTYTMKVLVPNGLWSVCPGGSAVTLSMAGDTIAGGDFPVQAIYFCPALTVSIGTNKLRRCFADNYYEVSYCNTGTQKAEDAFVTVILDQALTAMSVSVPYIDLGANALKVNVGDLEVGECGTFNIQVYVNCNAALGQTHCTQATIYPDTLCAPTNANWSGASLSIQSVCNSDSLRFTIRNDGKGAMSTSANYIVVEDGIMFRQGVLSPLAEDEIMEIAVPANGSTWRVEVNQETFHPFPSPVGLSVEACTTSPSFSLGFVNQFPAPDEPTAVDIDCTANMGSFDPNDKHGYPVGYGADHYIRPGTDIEYLIRFQNTGTDTAFTVQILDTLSSWLDPATIRFGASSHPYRYDLTGEGVVHFIFESILLPDSNTNNLASNGFVKFAIKPRLEAPLESNIENTAAIYFDFNDPVITNTTDHRLGHNFITVGLWQAYLPEVEIMAAPNPFVDQTILEVKGLSHYRDLQLQVFDIQGNLVRELNADQGLFLLKKGDWPSGIYLFRITQNGRLVGNGKLVAEQ